MAVVSLLLFPTDAGLSLLDAADHFINQYGIALAALVFLVVMGLGPAPAAAPPGARRRDLRHPAGRLVRVCLGVVTPLVLGWMMVDSLRAEFDENYGGYPGSFLAWAGWGVAVGALVVGVLISLVPWRRASAEDDAAGEPAEQGEEVR
ncbi:hypothetical protein TPA0909_53410 [Streptomyces albus]|nr:hypothetical protein TPA0909_53410 [Streptomyces albus]